MKVMTILGTRPELIKLSEIIKKLDRYTDHVFVHTGQNHDYELNEIFYKDLDLRKPDYFLNVVGESLGETIANVIKETEKVLVKESPDAVVILGDTNSALGGIIAKRMKIPIFHLEAGNRCFDLNVPEEINRTILDHIGDVNMVYSENSRRYLLDEGVAKDRIFVMGSPMKEILKVHDMKTCAVGILFDLGLAETLDYHDEVMPYEIKDYFLVNIHRDENTQIQENWDVLVDSINAIAEKYDVPVILSTHPRTMKKINEQGVVFDKRVRMLKPFGFHDYIALQRNAKCVISDSGTIAEESSLLGFRAITIRNAVERPEAVDVGSLLITGVDKENILRCLEIATSDIKKSTPPVDYDVDNCSDRVLKVVIGYTPYINKYVWHKR